MCTTRLKDLPLLFSGSQKEEWKQVGKKTFYVKSPVPVSAAHFPFLVIQKNKIHKRKECQQCRKFGIRAEIITCCPRCNVHLCITCFAEWHTDLMAVEDLEEVKIEPEEEETQSHTSASNVSAPELALDSIVHGKEVESRHLDSSNAVSEAMTEMNVEETVARINVEAWTEPNSKAVKCTAETETVDDTCTAEENTATEELGELELYEDPYISPSDLEVGTESSTDEDTKM